MPCYKRHKEGCVATTEAGPAPSLEPEAPSSAQPEKTEEPKHLRPLTSLMWPPEPDPMVFSDPLRRDDPKPLRPVELERIGA